MTKLDLDLAPKLQKDLTSQGFDLTKPAYTLFAAKKKGINCTLYESGKLVVQGKNSAEFIEFYLEPEILHDFSFTNPNLNIDQTARIGIDESGKGDFFGPLCVAGVFAVGEGIEELHKIGVRDCKLLKDEALLLIAKKIISKFPYHILRIYPKKYNQLYSQFGNLNHLLAWGHATTIEQLVEKTRCTNVLIDQFGNERLVKDALAKKNLNLNLTQRHRAEEDIVVAAASIVARAAFLKGLKNLEEKYTLTLPKGASKQVITAGQMFVKKYGSEELGEVAKLHFKTTDKLV